MGGTFKNGLTSFNRAGSAMALEYIDDKRQLSDDEFN